MSKNWYPMINYEDCIECGACIEKCSNGVYNIDKAPTPHVVNPGGCIEGCTGCGSLCPAGAITYFGDTGINKSEDCDCNSGCCCGDNKSSDDCCKPKAQPTCDCGDCECLDDTMK